MVSCQTRISTSCALASLSYSLCLTSPIISSSGMSIQPIQLPSCLMAKFTPGLWLTNLKYVLYVSHQNVKCYSDGSQSHVTVTRHTHTSQWPGMGLGRARHRDFSRSASPAVTTGNKALEKEDSYQNGHSPGRTPATNLSFRYCEQKAKLRRVKMKTALLLSQNFMTCS